MLAALKRLWAMQPVGRRLRFILIVAGMSAGAAMEMVGIGALLPIIGVMQAPGQARENAVLARLSELAGDPAPPLFFMYMLLALLAFFVLKNLFLVCLDVFQYRFWATTQARLSTQLIDSYLHRPYAFHLQVNTAQLIRNATTEVNTVFYYVLVPIGSLVSEALVVLALCALVVYVDWRTALVLTLSGSALVGTFYAVFRERMAQIGQHLQDSSGKMIQYAQEGLGGAKEIKVMGREDYFTEAFGLHVDRYARALRRTLVLHYFPARLLETVFIAAFVGVLVYFALSGRASGAIPLIGVYAAAAFRLIPSLNRIMTAMSRLKQGSTSIRLIVSELDAPREQTQPRSADPLPFEQSIRLEGLGYTYPGADAPAVRNVDLEIRRGEMVGFVGKSGSGKTTVVDCILGLLTPSRGRVLVDGVDIQSRMADWRSEVGYIPQHIYLTDDSLRKNVALGVVEDRIDDARIWRALEAAHLAEFARTLPRGIDSAIGEAGVRLSGGQRQRIGIARALYHDPAVLILDEATSALDNETERAIVDTLGGLKRERTILVIAHRMTSIDACDRVFVLDQGLLAEPTR